MNEPARSPRVYFRMLVLGAAAAASACEDPLTDPSRDRRAPCRRREGRHAGGPRYRRARPWRARPHRVARAIERARCVHRSRHLVQRCAVGDRGAALRRYDLRGAERGGHLGRADRARLQRPARARAGQRVARLARHLRTRRRHLRREHQHASSVPRASRSAPSIAASCPRARRTETHRSPTTRSCSTA